MTRPRSPRKQSAAPPRRWSGNEKLETLLVPLDDVALDPRNAREHPERNLRAIRHSLDTHGQLTPIVVGNHSKAVVRGNGTLLALRLDPPWSHVAAIQGRFKTPAQERAYALADNRTAELAEWDFEQLREDWQVLLDAGIDLGEIGWEPDEFDPLGSRKVPSEFLAVDENLTTEYECPRCHYRWSGRSDATTNG